MFDMPDISPEIRAKAQFRIRKQVVRINDMVSDILIFTEGTRARCRISKPADYRAFIQELDSRPPGRGRTEGRADRNATVRPPSPVRLDARRLSRVFYNLVHNATDLMPNGGKIFLRFQCR